MDLYGILAHPCGHSLSPLIHNAAFQKLNIDAQYTSFDIESEKLGNFIKRVRTEKIAGISVSIPHKIQIMQHLDSIDKEAKEIGAVNTLYWKKNQLCGTNTDLYGAMTALEEKTNLANKKIVIFGAGGAARAIAFGLKSKGAHLTILNRNLIKSQKLACPLKAVYGMPISYKKNYYDIVINTTPLGMFPQTEQSILSAEDLHPEQIVFDIVYNPLQTKLIQEAKKAGCTTITGEKMFLFQAAEQFKIWTKQKAPLETMAKILATKLS